MKRVLLLLAVIFPAILIAQVIENEGVQAMNYGEIALELGKYVLLGMFATASNHIAAFTFNGKMWIKDTLLPGVFAYAASMAIAFIDIYVEAADFFVEQIVGQTDSQNITKLAVVGVVAVGLIKGLIKRKKTQAKVAKAKAKAAAAVKK